MDPVTELLADLVRIPSVNPMGRPGASRADGFLETGVTDYLQQYLADRGVGCQRIPVLPDRDLLLAHYQSPDSARTILFDAHQDTVPVEGMTIPPFGATIENGRLYGRGACDIKGGLAAMLIAFLRLVNDRPRGSASVYLAFTIDEEYTHKGSSWLAANPPGPIDLAIVAEPTCFRLITSHKGAIRWKIHAGGTACHSSSPELGDNAIYRMGRILNAVEACAKEIRARTPDPILGAPSLSVGTVHGGLSVNVVPDDCVIEIDRRVLPSEDPELVQAELMEMLAARLTPGDREHLSFQPPWVRMPALRPNLPASTIDRLRSAIMRHTGHPPEVGGVPFGTDAGPLGRGGIPGVVVGPGDIAQAHTRDEWIELDAVRTAVDVYYQIALDLGSN